MGEIELSDAQRILRRAVQLDRAVPLPQTLTASALESAAADLGLAPEAVAMALAEARAGVDPADRLRRMDRMIGPRRVTVVRPCRVSASEVDRLAGEWLEHGHLLRVTRTAEGVVVARRRTDAVAGAGRAIRSLHGEGGLSKVREVRSAVGALADGTTAVCVHADVTHTRVAAVVVGSGTGLVALAGVGLGALLFSPFVAAGAPVAVVVGAVVARGNQRSKVTRIERALEETADAVAHGTAPPTPLAGLGRSLRRLAGRR